MSKYSLYKKYKSSGSNTLEGIVQLIQDGAMKDLQDRYRQAIAEKRSADYLKSLKDQFPAYTPSGLFHGERKIEGELTYSQEVNIDIDDISSQGKSIAELKAKLSKDPYIRLLFVSVGGDGLSVTMRVNSQAEDHVQAFIQCSCYLEWRYGIKCDPACKDITRLRYISHDPDVFYNPESLVFEVIPSPLYGELKSVEDFTGRIVEYEEGSRNRFVFQYACNANRRGIDQNHTLRYALRYFASEGFGPKEIRDAVESGYSHEEEHGISAESAESAEFAASSSVSSTEFHDTPCFQDWIFEKLPGEFDFIKELAADNRERDVMLIGSLGILSGIFPTISGTHSGKQVWSNLYFALYAAAGSGKGQLNFPYRVGRIIHDHLRKECDALKQKHKQACEACKKDENCPGDPPKPRCKALFIKGDISTSALKDHLNAGDHNVIYETESYVLSKNRGKDWANSEDVFLNAWEHEPIGKARVDDDKDVEITKPKLSVVVSGTPYMLQNLIPSVHSGFFSRTCFYVFAQELKFKDQFSDKHESTAVHIHRAQGLWMEVFEFNRKYPTKIVLTDAQKAAHLDLYSAWTADLKKSGIDREFFSSIVRNGRVLFKLVMILSAIRRCRENNQEKVFTCHDDDFSIARSICIVLNEHAKRVFVFLSKKTSFTTVCEKDRLLGMLPPQFDRKDVIVVGKPLGYSTRTLDEWLSNWVDTGKVIRLKHGRYEVANSSNSSNSAKSQK